MKTIHVALLIIGLVLSANSYSQSKLDNSTYTINYQVTDQIENQYDTLVKVSIIIEVADVNELSKIIILGGSEYGLSDKYLKSFDLLDEKLLASQQIEIPEKNTVKVNLGIYNLATEIIFFDIKLEDTTGVIIPTIKRIYPQ
jgi:hypothetical protein